MNKCLLYYSLFSCKFKRLYSFQRKDRLDLCYDLVWDMCVAVCHLWGLCLQQPSCWEFRYFRLFINCSSQSSRDLQWRVLIKKTGNSLPQRKVQSLKTPPSFVSNKLSTVPVSPESPAPLRAMDAGHEAVTQATEAAFPLGCHSPK